MKAKFALGVLFLSLAVAGCKSKPAAENNPPPADQAAQPAPAQAPPPSDQTAPATAPAAPATAAAAPAQEPAPMPTPEAAPAEPPPPPPPPPVVPAGTSVTVRLGSSLSSKTSHAGDTFQATLANSVRVRGNILIPAGAAVSGVVVDAKQRGKIKGEGELDIRLTGVNVRGNYYPLQTAVLEQTLKGKGKRTAVTTAGGGGAGALIGGLAGGGKGALIGLGVGAGAGLIGGAATGNKQIELPAETVLTFTLSSSLHL